MNRADSAVEVDYRPAGAEGAHPGASNAEFVLLGAEQAMIASKAPVVSVCAVRTGCGKSPVSRLVTSEIRKQDRKPVVIRHPMPYGDLAAQAVQRYFVLVLCLHEIAISLGNLCLRLINVELRQRSQIQRQLVMFV